MHQTEQNTRTTLREWGTVALVLLVLDLFWLGIFARDFYAHHLGPLLAPETNRSAAGIFYLFYVTVIWAVAVRDSNSMLSAGKRGAALGFVCYGVYELTNWAVLTDWPAILVPIDWSWGILLTATAAAVGRFSSVRNEKNRSS